jgi:hypothetical protein
MAPMKKRVEKEGGKEEEVITVEVKKEIIGKHEQGMQNFIISLRQRIPQY